jgi:hypothetical protein
VQAFWPSWLQPSHQLGGVIFAEHIHPRRQHIRMGLQQRLDFAKLNALAAQLDLPILSSDIVQTTLGISKY